jgi:hypothetical protein
VSEDIFAAEVLDYWTEKTGTRLRSPKVREAILARIGKRLGEGFAPDDLKRCVDFANYDEFYARQGYAKQPDVIWRNAERVNTILSRCAHAASRPLPL